MTSSPSGTRPPPRSALFGSTPLLKPDFEVAGARLYVSLWPIAVIDIGNGDRPTYEALFAKVDELVISRKEPYVMLTDTRRVTAIPGADVRKFMADWMKKNSVGHTSLGSVTIVRSALVKGGLTALYWLFTPPNPQGVAGDWAEAHAWSVKHFDAARVLIRPSVRDAIVQPY
jgi:hypothetical protein